MGSSKIKLDFLDPPTRDGDLGTLGHYRVIAQLGKGGMGYVFRAEDIKLERSVALKVMNRKIAATPHSRARFISEARAMAAVHHDNVATIFEVGEKNKTPFMAMEMLKGSTLERFKKAETRPPYQTIIKFAKEMARGLAAAHSKGIVHRDIKPANIWVEEENDRIKILDFGLALASTPVDQLAGRGAVIGTPGYLSPEQARSEPLDDRSDLYSMGVVLYELATGVLPLHNKTVAGQLIAILAHKPTPLRDLNPDVPQPLADLIHRLLRKEPRFRISSAAELEKQLDVAAVECESKSEVAQALNKLQMGLDKITKQKEEPVAAAPMMPDLPDPFATLPDNLGSGSGSYPAAPATAAPANTAPSKSGIGKSNPHRRQPSRKKAAAKSAPSPIQKYWPIGAAAAVAVIAIPLGLIAFSGPDKPNVISAPVVAVDSKDRKDPPKTNRNVPPKQKPSSQGNRSQGNRSQDSPPPKPQNNDSKEKETATLVKVVKINDAKAPGAVALINNNTLNGSFEQKGSGPLTGHNGAKSKIPGWSAIFKGQQAGWANQESRAATDGKSYAFIDRSSVIELNSDLLDYKTQPGDVFRIAFDIGGRGKRKGKAKYEALLNFQQDEKGPAANRYKIGESQDQTNVSQKNRTIGFRYTARDADVGLKPKVRLIMTEEGGQRSKSYLDNVRFTVQSKSKSNSLASDQPDPSQVAANTNPAVTQPSEMSSQPETMPIKSSPDPANTEPATPAVQMASKTIQTTEGVGADSTVKKGGSSRDQLGLKPTLSVQRRGKVEVQHSYMRFDLSSISPETGGNEGRGGNRKRGNQNITRKTGKAALVLHLTETKDAGGGVIRLFGTSTPESQLWGEQSKVAINWKNSFSSNGLSGLPLLAELQIPKNQSDRVLRISSDDLSDFVRTASQQSVTLVISGGSSGTAPISFVSREGNKAEAPALVVQVESNQ